MYRGTIYVNCERTEALLEYLEDTGWELDSEEHFALKGIVTKEYRNTYNEISVKIESRHKTEIHGHYDILKDIDHDFNGKDTMIINDK